MGTITFVGLDVHKATIAVSVAAGGREGEVRHLGRPLGGSCAGYGSLMTCAKGIEIEVSAADRARISRPYCAVSALAVTASA